MFLRGAGLAGGMAVMGVGPWRHLTALAEPARAGAGPYGPLAAPDANGIRLPEGFASRVVARSGLPVVPGGYVWHDAPDGAACFATADGGWVLVSNAELGAPRGGAGALRLAVDGAVVGGHRILDGTSRNCAGGVTPWGTWLSCEEVERGLVYECDPLGVEPPTRADVLGRFVHEAAGVDAAGRAIYLTEDSADGRLYRALPVWPEAGRPDLRAGRLQAAAVDVEAALRGPAALQWIDVPPTGPYRGSDTARFRRGEGLWCHAGVVYFSTTADNRVWAIDTVASTLEVVYAGGADLRAPDNITVSPSGEVFVGEDGDDMQLVVLAGTPDGGTEVAPFLQIVGHPGSEVTGPCFSPDGTRLYVTSQRGSDGRGAVFEVSGPFTRTSQLPRQDGAAGPAPAPPEPRPEPEPGPAPSDPTAPPPSSAPPAPTTAPQAATTAVTAAPLAAAPRRATPAPPASRATPARHSDGRTPWAVAATAAAAAAAVAAARAARSAGTAGADDRG